MDPSFKKYEYLEGIDVKQVMGFEPDTLYNAATAGGNQCGNSCACHSVRIEQRQSLILGSRGLFRLSGKTQPG